jgi:tRNA C32,U32 (ribose-2'-O)-methylase TrmJ
MVLTQHLVHLLTQISWLQEEVRKLNDTKLNHYYQDTKLNHYEVRKLKGVLELMCVNK